VWSVLCFHAVQLSIHASICHVVSVISVVIIDGFHRTFVSGASWDRDELFLDQKVKGQEEAYSRHCASISNHLID